MNRAGREQGATLAGLGKKADAIAESSVIASARPEVSGRREYLQRPVLPVGFFPSPARGRGTSAVD